MPTYSAPDQIAPTSLNDYLEVMSRAVFQGVARDRKEVARY